jgi:hypothetical protein
MRIELRISFLPPVAKCTEGLVAEILLVDLMDPLFDTYLALRGIPHFDKKEFNQHCIDTSALRIYTKYTCTNTLHMYDGEHFLERCPDIHMNR